MGVLRIVPTLLLSNKVDLILRSRRSLRLEG